MYNGHGFFVSMSQTSNGLYPRIIPFFYKMIRSIVRKKKKITKPHQPILQLYCQASNSLILSLDQLIWGSFSLLSSHQIIKYSNQYCSFLTSMSLYIKQNMQISWPILLLFVNSIAHFTYKIYSDPSKKIFVILLQIVLFFYK